MLGAYLVSCRHANGTLNLSSIENEEKIVGFCL